MTETITIRIAETTEQKALEALQWRASLNNPGDRDALLANPDAIELPLDQITAGGVFIAERDGVIVGFAAVLLRADGQTELDGLFVEPAIWKCGVGRLLVEHCGEFARAQGASALHVVGNPHAKDFYSACGFEVVGEHQTRFGVGLAMQKKLRDLEPTNFKNIEALAVSRSEFIDHSQPVARMERSEIRESTNWHRPGLRCAPSGLRHCVVLPRKTRHRRRDTGLLFSTTVHAIS